MAKDSSKTPTPPPTPKPEINTHPGLGDVRGDNPNLPAMKNPPPAPPKKSN